MRLDLPGRTVVITGASGGLGAGLARALRARGANVALLDLDADAVRRQAERLGWRPVRARLVDRRSRPRRP